MEGEEEESPEDDEDDGPRIDKPKVLLELSRVIRSHKGRSFATKPIVQVSIYNLCACILLELIRVQADCV